MPRYTAENVIKVYNDETGEHVYIGPDGDSLDLVELRAVNRDGEIYPGARITMNQEEALLVADAIIKLYGSKN